MCVEVIIFSALALYLGMLLYFQIQREKIIMKQINPTHANSRATHERDLISRADAICEVLVNDGVDNIVGRINALPSATLQNLTEPNKSCEVDLISRADALRELNGACSNWQDDAKVAEIINALPSEGKEEEK